LGRTTVSATVVVVEPTADFCPLANSERHNDRSTGAKL
jgi:hypothetical protein